MTKMYDLLQEIESNIIHSEVRNERVSKSNIAWHLDHSLKVINSVATVLQKSPADYKWNFNLKRDYFLFIKRIPRGKAKAPKAVQSLNEITTPSIERQLRTARHLIQEMETMDPKTNFIHPYIGKLNLKQAFTFIQIHTQHHLKIIDDIQKK